MNLMVVAILALAAPLKVPDPTTSVVPAFVYVVGFTGPGAPHPDVDGAGGPAAKSNVIVVRDFMGNPETGVTVRLQFPCDLSLCTATVAGQTVDCSTNSLSGPTDLQGRFLFTAVGAARDQACGSPGCVGPGGGLRSTIVTIDGYSIDFGACTAVALDQNGASAGAGTNGTSLGDVSRVLHLAGAVALANNDSSLYRGRGDLNADGAITFADVAAELAQFGRLALLGSTSCVSTYCPPVPCP